MKMNRKILIFFLVLALAVIVLGCSSGTKTEFPQQQVTIFKSESCGCCGAYTNYMQKQGFAVQVNDVPSMNPIKAQYDVPVQMQSCHTSIIGNYFVEGHIPREAIDKLLSEKPAIAGIAMPGMPSGSPGMPGSKEPFIIYAIGTDGSIAEFMRM